MIKNSTSYITHRILLLFCSLLLRRKLQRFIGVIFGVIGLVVNSFAQAPTSCGAPVPIDNCCAAIGGLPTDSHFTMSPDPDNVTFTFDNFGEYLAGISQYGATTLRLTIVDGTGLPGPCPGGGCRWTLHIMVDNSANIVPPAAAPGEWAKLVLYGTPGSGTIPTINPFLQMRVRNACNTSETQTGFVTIASTANFRCIIDNNCTSGTVPDNGVYPDKPAGSCTVNVNEAGSYLTNPGEYTFIIDYQVKLPTLTYQAGQYQLMVKYCLRNE